MKVKENIVEIIAVCVLTFTFILEVVVLLNPEIENSSTTIKVLSTNENISLLIVGYYFGSSKGSKDKQDKLDQIP